MSEEDKEIGIKYDEHKPRWSLLPLKAVEEIVKVLTFGATKYEENSWQNLEDFNDRYFSALIRHLTKWQSGENYDDESGLHHLSHAACNIIFLIYNNVPRVKK